MVKKIIAGCGLDTVNTEKHDDFLCAHISCQPGTK